MLDRRSREEFEGVLALGRLADRMVSTLGKVVRRERLEPDDEAALEAAQRLFERMTEQDVIVIDQAEDTMLNDESYLDAIRVVQLQANGGEIEEHAKRYLSLLEKAKDGSANDEERQELAGLRELFVEVGETTLARASDLSRARQEPTWQLMRPPISSF